MTAESVIKEAGTQTLGTYSDKWQEKVVEWVALSLILEVFDMDMGYEGRGRRCEPWWWKPAAWKHLRSTLEEIPAAERARQHESGRRGEGRGGGEVTEYYSGREGY